MPVAGQSSHRAACEPLWKRDTNLCIAASVFLLLYSVWLACYGIWAYRHLSTPARPRISAPLSYIDGGPRKSEADTIRSFGSVVSFGTAGAPSMWTAGTHTLPSTPQKLHKLGDRTEVLTEAEVDGGSALHVPVDEEEGDDVFLDKPRAHFLVAESSSPHGSLESARDSLRDSFKTAPGSTRTSLQAARELDQRLSVRPIASSRQYSVFETDSSADGESRKSMATSVGSPSPKRKTLPALPPSASARSSAKANERASGVSSVASGRDGRLSSRISDILSGMPPPPPIPAGGFDLGRWGQAGQATRSTTELTAAAAALPPPPPSYAPDRRSARNSRLTTRTTASDRLTNRGSHVPSEAGVTPALSMGHSSSESSGDESDMGMRFEPLPAFTPLRLSFELPE